MTAPAPEKAAPIPADVRKLCVRIYDEAANRDERLSIYELMERAIMQDRADREARPSLPDSREERIREDAARLDWLEANRNVHVQYEGWEEDVWEVYRVNGGRSDREWNKIAESSSLRDAIDLARARQGGNNGRSNDEAHHGGLPSNQRDKPHGW